MNNRVEIMKGQISELTNQIEWIQETCQHINKQCDGDYQDSTADLTDVFSDPFADGSFEVKKSGTIIECYCPHCLKTWVEVVL